MLVMYYMPYATSKCNVMLENNVCNVSYVVLSFMSAIIRCCLILCYLFMFMIIMFIEGIHYKLFNFISFLFPNMYISSCMTCLYVDKLENNV